MSITNNEMNFNNLEKEILKLCFKIGCEEIKSVLEKWDKELCQARDKIIYRNKGKRKTVIKTVMGEVEYFRTMYEIKSEDGTIKRLYLLDEAMGIKGSGHMSELFSNMITKAVCESPYREAARSISELTGQTISHTAAWNVAQEVGNHIEKQENEKAKLAENNSGKGEIGTKVLFEEQDGIYINLQGEDRKKYGKSKEMKVGIAYDGAEETYVKSKAKKKRYKLTNKVACANFENVKNFQKRKEGIIANVYNVNEIEMRFLNGDGANWIKNSIVDDTVHFQLDPFHRNKAVKTYVKNPEMQENIMEMLHNNDIDNLLVYIEALSNSVETDEENGGEEKQNLLELLKYFTNNKDGLVPFNQRKIKICEPPDGKEYRNMGCMESNIFTIIGNRMKGRRACWSLNGGNNLARLLCLKHTGKLADVMQNLTTVTLPEKYADEIIVKLSSSKIVKSVGKGFDGYHKTSAPSTSNYKWLRNMGAIQSL